MRYPRNVVSAFGFLDGATPLLFLAAAVSPVVCICSYGLAFLIFIPIVCFLLIRLGFASSSKARNSWNSTPGLSAAALRGYAVGAIYIIGYCYLLGAVAAHAGKLDNVVTGCLSFAAFPHIPIVVFYAALFYGELSMTALEHLAGFQGEAANSILASRRGGPKSEIRGFVNGGLTLAPALFATLFDFSIGQAWRPLGDRTAPVLSPGLDVNVEAARMLTLLAVLRLHQTLLILLISRARAARAGNRSASAEYLRVFCFLAAGVIAVLLAAFIAISRAKP